MFYERDFKESCLQRESIMLKLFFSLYPATQTDVDCSHQVHTHSHLSHTRLLMLLLPLLSVSVS